MGKRIIKFRAWHLIDKEMRSHDWLHSAGVVYSALFRDRSDIEIMQFTGYTDRDHVEVYEGDVIAYDLLEGLGLPARTGLKRVVKITPLGAFGQWDTNIKVLGNIFQNPELV